MAKIDYIVPTWNSGATLLLTLRSIKKYGNPNQIIIVDRYSKDETIRIANEFECEIVMSDKPLGAARRMGAEISMTDLIGFVDSDVELTPEWVEIIRCILGNIYEDAGVVSAHYNDNYVANITSTVALNGGNGAFGCCITYRKLILECEDLDNYSSAEDGIYAKYLAKNGLKWYLLPVVVLHHQNFTDISYYSRWRWLGAGLRMKDGFSLLNIKRIMGGAIFGIRISNLNISYWKNFRIRCNYFLGYMRYKKYYEINRD
ncbi:MAG: glycosyltransferase family 2 protein [Methanothrix sp.]|jgi:glycosyltransferase involved in cell wall biosynthesis|uniref:Glycosyl transferase family protein n=1 Tax=Methanothrix harundinacea TaxID=301375 RepID=A0A101FRS1_9EURY|nr:MAG: Glycosyl transferase family protein [Methanothrix harundinacea]MCP1391452.1 glycosyltransferase family 2 protein [Methanothrix harundinacea]MDD3709000.1 glycosyltransferase family 2 protein [Methanothrix sp.]MDD5768486.1 glycosyltransferase family 2 protein [Methanothrix sp.]